ncbi:hypothetical protein LOS24_01530 [Enterococcus faecium]|nr:hypothetical protein [Enterococcus faecium]
MAIAIGINQDGRCLIIKRVLTWQNANNFPDKDAAMSEKHLHDIFDNFSVFVPP